MCVMMYAYCWIYFRLYVGSLYIPVLTHPCSSMLGACDGVSLVCTLAKVQDLLEWSVELLANVAMVTGGMVFCPVVG